MKNTQKRPRRSWVLWEERGKYPDLLIELLLESTARTDRNLTKELYQERFRTPEYFWFSPETLEFAGYRLVNQQYQLIDANASGWLWSQPLELYLGVEAGVLRYFTAAGDLVLSPQEEAERAKLEAQAQQQALQAEARAARLAQQLRSLGVEPED